MKRIPLTKNKYALVDDRDYKNLSQFPWHIFITGAPKGMVVDHINNNGLDNRRSNLRVCTQSENARNSKVGRGKVPTRGVYVSNCGEKYMASIGLGTFKTEKEASEAYKRASKLLFKK